MHSKREARQNVSVGVDEKWNVCKPMMVGIRPPWFSYSFNSQPLRRKEHLH